MIDYKNVKKFIKPFKSKKFKLEHFELSEERVNREKMYAMFSGKGMEVISLKPGTYVRLIDIEKQQIIMSDTPMELDTNREFIENAKGDVLIGGLGLGIILLAIQSKKEVKSIIVCEKEKELIDKIGNNLPLNKKVTIIHDDINTFEINEKFDTIYFDIWNNICSDNYDDMKLLHKRFRKNLNKDSWMRSWRFKDCKRLKYEENKDLKLRQDYENL